MRRADVHAVIAAQAEVQVFLKFRAVAEQRCLERPVPRHGACDLHLASGGETLVLRRLVSRAAEMALGAVGASLRIDAII